MHLTLQVSCVIGIAGRGSVTSRGLPKWLRIATQSLDHCKKLLYIRKAAHACTHLALRDGCCAVGISVWHLPEVQSAPFAAGHQLRPLWVESLCRSMRRAEDNTHVRCGQSIGLQCHLWTEPLLHCTPLPDSQGRVPKLQAFQPNQLPEGATSNVWPVAFCRDPRPAMPIPHADIWDSHQRCSRPRRARPGSAPRARPTAERRRPWPARPAATATPRTPPAPPPPTCALHRPTAPALMLPATAQ